MGPVRQNPIQRTVRSVHMCVQFTVYNRCTQYCTEQTWQFSVLPSRQSLQHKRLVVWSLTSLLGDFSSELIKTHKTAVRPCECACVNADSPALVHRLAGQHVQYNVSVTGRRLPADLVHYRQHSRSHNDRYNAIRSIHLLEHNSSRTT